MLINYILIITILISITVSINILHISDIHLDMEYAVNSAANCFIGDNLGTRCCHTNNIPVEPKRYANKWGDYNCDTPKLFLNETLKFISSHFDIDMILWTGDTAGHHVLTQTYSENFEAIELATKLLKEYFPKSIIIPSIGNHDTYPINQFPPPYWNRIYLNKFYSYWKNLVPINKIFLYGGYYSIDYNTTKIININTLYYETTNFMINRNQDNANQIKWLISELEEAKITNKKVWLIGHIPPTNREATKFFKDNMKQIMLKYCDIIVYQFFGHTHKDELVVYKDSGCVGFIMSSIEPDQHQSSFRIYYTNNNLDIIDYTQYIINLNETITNNRIIAYPYYSARKDYNFNKLDNKELYKMVYNMYDDYELFNKFYNHYHVNSTYDNCDDNCRKVFLDSMIL